MVGRFPGKSFVFMEFQKRGGIAELAALLLLALGLDVAELVEDLLELAGEACAVESESGYGAMGVDDVEFHGGLLGGRVGGQGEELGFE